MNAPLYQRMECEVLETIIAPGVWAGHWLWTHESQEGEDKTKPAMRGRERRQDGVLMEVQERGAQGSGGGAAFEPRSPDTSMTKQREPGVRHCPTPTAFSWIR